MAGNNNPPHNLPSKPAFPLPPRPQQAPTSGTRQQQEQQQQQRHQGPIGHRPDTTIHYPGRLQEGAAPPTPFRAPVDPRQNISPPPAQAFSTPYRFSPPPPRPRYGMTPPPAPNFSNRPLPPNFELGPPLRFGFGNVFDSEPMERSHGGSKSREPSLSPYLPMKPPPVSSRHPPLGSRRTSESPTPSASIAPGHKRSQSYPPHSSSKQTEAAGWSSPAPFSRGETEQPISSRAISEGAGESEVKAMLQKKLSRATTELFGIKPQHDNSNELEEAEEANPKKRLSSEASRSDTSTPEQDYEEAVGKVEATAMNEKERKRRNDIRISRISDDKLRRVSWTTPLAARAEEGGRNSSPEGEAMDVEVEHLQEEGQSKETESSKEGEHSGEDEIVVARQERGKKTSGKTGGVSKSKGGKRRGNVGKAVKDFAKMDLNAQHPGGDSSEDEEYVGSDTSDQNDNSDSAWGRGSQPVPPARYRNYYPASQQASSQSIEERKALPSSKPSKQLRKNPPSKAEDRSRITVDEEEGVDEASEEELNFGSPRTHESDHLGCTPIAWRTFKTLDAKSSIQFGQSNNRLHYLLPPLLALAQQNVQSFTSSSIKKLLESASNYDGGTTTIANDLKFLVNVDGGLRRVLVFVEGASSTTYSFIPGTGRVFLATLIAQVLEDWNKVKDWDLTEEDIYKTAANLLEEAGGGKGDESLP